MKLKANNMTLPICPFCGCESVLTTEVGFYCRECETNFYESDLSSEDDYFKKNNFENTIDPLEEKIWDIITKSAKRRFDYRSYLDSFPEYVNKNMKDNVSSPENSTV